ncbi:MAG: AI-2E family transporter [Bacteroidia bacterium]|nr:AI-2E family transporter [Bacteroidia bacterium]
MLSKQSSSQSKQKFGFYILVVFGIFLFVMLYDYLTAFLGALIFYILFSPLMNYLVEKRKWKASLASISILLITLLIVVIPSILVVNMLYQKLALVVNDPDSLLNAFHTFDDKLAGYLGHDLIGPEQIETIKKKAAELLPGLLNRLLSVFSSLAIMYFILYYMLVSYKSLSRFGYDFLPFNERVTAMFMKELYDMTISNSIATPLLAMAQGLAAGLAFYFLGIPDAIFWGSLCGIFSFIPVVGSAIIWLPAALYLFAIGKSTEGTILTGFGTLVIANIDNVLRMALQKRFADVHPIISIFGILIGLNLFGMPGLIFGPLLISYFVLGVQIYRKNYVIPKPELEETTAEINSPVEPSA